MKLFCPIYSAILLLTIFHTELFCQCNCTPLQNTTTDSIQVSNVSQLVNAVNQANSTGNLTILVSNGVYQLTNMLYITGNNVTVRSKNRNRDLVTIRGAGMNGAVGFIFNVAGRNFKALDLTIGWVRYHAIQIHGELNSNNAVIQNVKFVDIYEQMLKISYNPSDTAGAYNGIVECCLFEYTAGIGPNYYIGGVDGHNCKNWIVRNNVFKHIRSPQASLAEHAIHFWSASANTLVEGNTIVNCDRGIGFGLGDRGHIGGVIKNNFVYTTRDIGIGLETTTNAQVYNNSVYTDNYQNSIEYRFSSGTGNQIANNLTNKSIVSRDGGQATLQNNYTSAASSMFVNYSAGDLHLTSNYSQIVNQGMTLPSVIRDFDCQTRPINGVYDIGADEYGSSIGISQIGSEVPEEYFLWQNYPNPFNPSTNIKFQLPKPGFVRLLIYDISGNEAAVLVNNELRPGTYEVDWDASNYPSGVYFYNIQSGGFSMTKKMVILK